jgi:hypothetical protein
MIRPIKAGFLVSYDYELIKNSLPPVYEYADKIVLAVDKDGKTWSGNSFQIPDSFWQWIKEFDTQHKIEIYRDSFYVEGLTSVQNDTRERNMLGEYMGEGGWHVQIDADEYFTNFKAFVDFLHQLDKDKKPINCVYLEWLTLYKRASKGYLIVKGNGGSTALATTKPNYICCRIIDHERKILYPQRVLHESWARTEKDALTKLINWSHNNDFDTAGYFNYWKAINKENYMFARDFHPYEPETWKELEYIEAYDIPTLLQKLRESKKGDLLQVSKQENKIRKIAKLCIPPIFSEIRKYFNHSKYMTALARQTEKINKDTQL